MLRYPTARKVDPMTHQFRRRGGCGGWLCSSRANFLLTPVLLRPVPFGPNTPQVH